MNSFKYSLRKQLFNLSDFLEKSMKKVNGVAGRLEPGRVISIADCERENWRNIRPCFVLSTGRTGTLLLNRLLRLSPEVLALHQPGPELVRSSRRAYEEMDSKKEVFLETFKSCREELVLKAAVRSQVYTETNNWITFFAPVIPAVFPKAVFIHLVRHPADFVRSGIRRGWYSGKHDYDIGRIIPRAGSLKDKWDGLTIIEKIGWLWNETNQFIENFKLQIGGDKCLFVKSEELFSDPEIVRKIYSFINLEGFKRNSIKRLIKKPVNVQKEGEFPEYADWPEDDKKSLRKMAVLSSEYGYKL